MTAISQNDFVSRVEDLLREFPDVQSIREDFRRRLHDTLLEGYSRALALEAQCRQLRNRQMKLAALCDPDEQVLRELASLARRQASIEREGRGLRALVGRLHDRERRLCRPLPS